MQKLFYIIFVFFTWRIASASELDRLYSIMNNQEEADRLITLKSFKPNLPEIDIQDICGQLQVGRIFFKSEYRNTAIRYLQCSDAYRGNSERREYSEIDSDSDRRDYSKRNIHSDHRDYSDPKQGDEKCSPTGTVLRFSHREWVNTYSSCNNQGEPIEGDEKCSPSGTILQFRNHRWSDSYIGCKL